MGTHSRSEKVDRLELSDAPNGAKHPASRIDAGLARQAHLAALELQGSASRFAEDQNRAARNRSRRRSWLLVAVLLLAAAVIAAVYGWRLGG